MSDKTVTKKRFAAVQEGPITKRSRRNKPGVHKELCDAIQADDSDAVRTILDQHPSFKNILLSDHVKPAELQKVFLARDKGSNHHQTILDYAAFHHSVAVLKVCLEDYGLFGYLNKTSGFPNPLHWAMRKKGLRNLNSSQVGNLEKARQTIALLVSHGLDPAAIERGTRTRVVFGNRVPNQAYEYKPLDRLANAQRVFVFCAFSIIEGTVRRIKRHADLEVKLQHVLPSTVSSVVLDYLDLKPILLKSAPLVRVSTLISSEGNGYHSRLLPATCTGLELISILLPAHDIESWVPQAVTQQIFKFLLHIGSEEAYGTSHLRHLLKSYPTNKFNNLLEERISEIELRHQKMKAQLLAATRALERVKAELAMLENASEKFNCNEEMKQSLMALQEAAKASLVSLS